MLGMINERFKLWRTYGCTGKSQEAFLKQSPGNIAMTKRVAKYVLWVADQLDFMLHSV